METFKERSDSLCQTIQRYMPGADMEIIDRAVDYARDKHQEQHEV